jgi:predicted PurR-regulated permease PerM
MKNLKNINQILLFVFIVLALFYFGSSFLIPFVFGIFFATLLSPFSNLVEKIWKNRIFSSLLGTLLVFVVVGGVLYIFVYQMTLFVSDISAIRNEIESLIQNIQDKIMTATNISLEEQKNIWQSRSANILNSLESRLSSFLGNILYTTASFLPCVWYMYSCCCTTETSFPNQF